ncbi:MAG: hypothetical protein EB084_16770 [Proteobacteria bacterium]|nr:hypothetical protein [Pseudomonadota bacterium]
MRLGWRAMRRWPAPGSPSTRRSICCATTPRSSRPSVITSRPSTIELSDLIGSADGKRMQVFAQGLTLDLLVAYANEHLGELARRYRLMRVPHKKEALALQVVDLDMGDEVRSVDSLSGGETFLVSLALALGLSSLSAQRARIDSLFIDEGFGSLDAETLETALAALESLQATGRQIGLISHVPGISERVGAVVRVERQGAGRSVVRVSRG